MERQQSYMLCFDFFLNRTKQITHISKPIASFGALICRLSTRPFFIGMQSLHFLPVALYTIISQLFWCGALTVYRWKYTLLPGIATLGDFLSLAKFFCFALVGAQWTHSLSFQFRIVCPNICTVARLESLSPWPRSTWTCLMLILAPISMLAALTSTLWTKWHANTAPQIVLTTMSNIMTLPDSLTMTMLMALPWVIFQQLVSIEEK